MVTHRPLAHEASSPHQDSLIYPFLRSGESQTDAAPQSTVVGLEIRTLGSFSVTQHRASGEVVQVPGSAWRHGRTLALVNFLLTRPGFEASHALIRDQLWPHADPQAANSYLSNTLWNLRKAFGTSRNQNTLLAVSDGGVKLRVVSGDQRGADGPTHGGMVTGIWVDNLAFDAAAKQVKAALAPTQVLLTAQRALDLYQGEYLPRCPEPLWSFSLRERLRETWASVLLFTARAYMDIARVEEAIETLDRLLESIPEHEEAAAFALRLFVSEHRTREALALFERLRSHYRSVYRMEPPRFLRQIIGPTRGAVRTTVPLRGKPR